ncbi:MAG: hypothetical protein GKR89_20590 [Candidatus Latescibacteria bacterium]|nr:hypothetical protein [Candidatus Latescibacterota bacterium]
MEKENPSPVEIGTARQLFVDDFWIDRASGVQRILHQPVQREITLAPEYEWEAGGLSYLTTFVDGGKIRGWYRADPLLQDADARSITCYAESDDGIHWRKPELGLVNFQGSKANNIVWAGPGINLAPFKDGNPQCLPDERYKALIRIERVLYALVSADGLSWRLLQQEPVLTDYPFDTLNRPFWDSWRGEYVAYCRGVGGRGSGNFFDGVRWIRRTTSADFRHWAPLLDIDCGDTPWEHLYTNSCVQYERAPGTYLMFPSRFVTGRSPDPDWTYDQGVSDIVFMASRDGLHFDRSFMEAFIRPGLDFGNWHDRGIYFEVGLLETSPTQLSMYGMENAHLPTQRIRRYTLRPDGFVSVNSGYGGGEFTTRPLIFAGHRLSLNYSTSAVGSVRVEVQDALGQPLEGLALDDCPERYGDQIDGVVGWSEGGDLGRWEGTVVRLRFVLKDADLYAFKFS